MNSLWKIGILCQIGLLAAAVLIPFCEAYDYYDASPPIITTMPQKITQKEGLQLQLDCDGENLYDYAVIWTFGSRILAAAGTKLSNDVRINVLENDTIRIEQAAMTDSGIYTCTIWRNVTLDHIVFIVSAYEAAGKPHVLVPTPIIVVNQSEPVSLKCHSIGSPPPTVSWIRQSGNVFPSGDKVVQGSTITFQNVSRHHAGQYVCSASNSIGSASTSVQLEVNYAPEIEVESESLHSAVGSDVDLTCTIHAEPRLKSVKWYFNGMEINPKNAQYEISEQLYQFGTLSVSTLRIKNVGKKDYGDYVCTAENRLGRRTGVIQFTGKPSQPILNDTRTGGDHSSYRLVWTMESSIPIEDFKLSYRKEDGQWRSSLVTGEQSPNVEFVYVVTHTLKNLTSNSDYEVILSAMNKNGWSRSSRIHKFRLKKYQSLVYVDTTARGHEDETARVSEGGSSSSIIKVSVFLFFLLLFTMTF